MVLADADFTKDLRAFASSHVFQSLFKVTDEQHKSQGDLEYVVRLIVHSRLTSVDARVPEQRIIMASETLDRVRSP